MIGLDFPVKPAWIHDVLRLWQPGQPISALVQAALAQTMGELGGEKTRRNSLTVILRYFVPTTGGGQTRRTAPENVWAAYAAANTADALAPAYLAQIITHNAVAQDTTQLIVKRCEPGGVFSSSELRRYVIGRYGQRKVVTNSASAFLRSLHYFGVLAPGQRTGNYRFAARLPIGRPVFPLVVWAWWEAHPTPQIELDTFAADPAVAFLDREEFLDLWRVHQPGLWVLEERLESRRATVKYSDIAGWQQALLALPHS